MKHVVLRRSAIAAAVASLLLAFTSCERWVKVPFDGNTSKPVIYIEGKIIAIDHRDTIPHFAAPADSVNVFNTAQIAVGRTLEWHEPKGLVVLPDAQCTALMPGGKEITLQYNDTLQRYLLPYRTDELRPGDSIVLTVSHPDYKTARAVTVVPNPVALSFGAVNQQYTSCIVKMQFSNRYPDIADAPTAVSLNTYCQYVDSDGHTWQNSPLSRSDDPFMKTALGNDPSKSLQSYYGKKYFYDYLLDMSKVPTMPYTAEIEFVTENSEYQREKNVCYVRFDIKTLSWGFYKQAEAKELGVNDNPFMNPHGQYSNVENGAGIFGVEVISQYVWINPAAKFKPKNDYETPENKGDER